ncbi:hypothetical protein [Streptomyces sp. NPDC059491]|uniref:hypothetical protein n=1 Tax=Streptomyces sp. NPDC059491 TaxID=3346850 RepID=UPI0036CA7A43
MRRPASLACEAALRSGNRRADKLTVGGADRPGDTYVLTAVDVDAATPSKPQ